MNYTTFYLFFLFIIGNSGSTTPKSSPNKPACKLEDEKSSFSKELARLQFYGAGPKMAGMPNDKTIKEKTRGIKLNFDYDPLAKYMCQNCGKGKLNGFFDQLRFNIFVTFENDAMFFFNFFRGC